ncbi:hypothetical protein E4U48_003224 [Claviceps purpurea]|nr:hypothetical protein E4U26_000399 [Claviceps purpurea]KAG6282764.1 hypothetical protein E4U48_003224 [Claviceps purpurea]
MALESWIRSARPHLRYNCPVSSFNCTLYSVLGPFLPHYCYNHHDDRLSRSRYLRSVLAMWASSAQQVSVDIGPREKHCRHLVAGRAVRETPVEEHGTALAAKNILVMRPVSKALPAAELLIACLLRAWGRHFVTPCYLLCTVINDHGAHFLLCLVPKRCAVVGGHWWPVGVAPTSNFQGAGRPTWKPPIPIEVL